MFRDGHNGNEKETDQLFTTIKGLKPYLTSDTGLHQLMSTSSQQRDLGEVKELKFDPLVSCDKNKDDLSYSGNGKSMIGGGQRMEEITDFLNHGMESTTCKHSPGEPTTRHRPSLNTGASGHELKFLEIGHKKSAVSESKQGRR